MNYKVWEVNIKTGRRVVVALFAFKIDAVHYANYMETEEYRYEVEEI